MNPSGQPQDSLATAEQHIKDLQGKLAAVDSQIEAKITSPHIEGLQSNLSQVNSELEEAYRSRAAEVLEKLSREGVSKEMSISLASVEASMAEASAAGASLGEIFDTVEDASLKLISHLTKNPALKTLENSKMVFERTKTIMKEDSNKLFVDVLMEAVRDREYSVGSNVTTLYVKDGAITKDPGNFIEG